MELIFNARSANSSFVELIWHTHSERAGTFTSVAVSNWEMVITSLDGKTTITARGPETRASEADFPAAAEFFGIIFKLGTFMPHLPVKILLDRQDATLPEASRNSFSAETENHGVPGSSPGPATFTQKPSKGS